MSEVEPLGTFEALDVRDRWKDEAANFTPWLAREEGIAALGKALGLELEVEKVEAAVGPYSADILAKDIGTGKYVVIENQLGKTDHDHLGKAITYGSVLDASAVVWIAAEFSEQHEKALNWLNEYTADELAFYGVRLELWRIDDSKPAVRFNVICRPAGLKREEAIRLSTEELSETQRLQLDFWTVFREKLLAARVVASAQKARGQSAFDVPIGRSHIFLSNIVNTFDKRIGARLYIGNKVAEQALPQLEAQRDEIETEIGQSLAWNPDPENRDKVIALYREADVWQKGKWDEYTDWLVDMVARFRKAFMPRVKELKL